MCKITKAEERGRVKTGVREAEAVLFAGNAGGVRPAGRQKAGVSLIISVVLIGVLMFFAMAISVSVIDGIKQSGSVNRANVAYFATEGALEKGLEMNFESGAGQNTAAQTILFNGDPECSAESDCSKCCGKYNAQNDPNGTLNSQCISGCYNLYGQSGTTAKPQTVATFKIQGSVPKIKGAGEGPGTPPFDGTTYSIPSAGTGDAGKNCDPLNPPVTTAPQLPWWYLPSADTFGTTSTKPSEAIAIADVKDHPCNWGKIKVGQTIAVPLYYIGSDGKPANLLGLGSSFQLRVRTPCANSAWQYCNPLNGTSDGRYQLDWFPADGHGDKKYNYNDPVVSWQIMGSDKTKSDTYALGPFVKIVGGYIDLQSTLISEKSIALALVNSTYPARVLHKLSKGTDLKGCTGPIIDFLGNVGTNLTGCATSVWALPNQEIVKPVFKFTVIHALNDKANPQNTVPYLEYQVLMSNTVSSAQPTNAYQTITGESVSGSYKQVLEVKMPQESGILEYVIQQ